MGLGTNGTIARDVGRIFRHGSAASLTDRQLLDRFSDRGGRGESAEAAFEALMARHGPMVRGVCRRLLRDAHEADDAFQAAFLVLVRRATSVRVGASGSLGPWLHGVAGRIAGRLGKRRARGQERERGLEFDPPGDAPPDWSALDRAERLAALHEEIARLPEPLRAPVVLCHLEGLSQDEAASRLGCPTSTVKGRLFRARERLRERLTRRGLALSSAAIGGLLAREARALAAPVPTLLADATARAALAAGVRGLALAATGTVPAAVASLTEGTLRHYTMAHTFKCFAAGALALGLLAGGPAVLRDAGGPAQGAEGGSPGPGRSDEPDRQTPFDERTFADIPTQVDERATGRLMFGLGATSFEGVARNQIAPASADELGRHAVTTEEPAPEDEPDIPDDPDASVVVPPPDRLRAVFFDLPITLHLHDVPFRDAASAIAQATGLKVRVAYGPNMEAAGWTPEALVSIDCEGTPLQDMLKSLRSPDNHGLGYSIDAERLTLLLSVGPGMSPPRPGASSAERGAFRQRIFDTVDELFDLPKKLNQAEVRVEQARAQVARAEADRARAIADLEAARAEKAAIEARLRGDEPPSQGSKPEPPTSPEPDANPQSRPSPFPVEESEARREPAADAPSLTVELDGPPVRLEGSEAALELKVRNDTSGPALNAMIALKLPVGLRPTLAEPQNAHWAGERRTLYWNIKALPPTESRSFRVLVRSDKPGRHQVVAGARADGFKTQRRPITLTVSASSIDRAAGAGPDTAGTTPDGERAADSPTSAKLLEQIDIAQREIEHDFAEKAREWREDREACRIIDEEMGKLLPLQKRLARLVSDEGEDAPDTTASLRLSRTAEAMNKEVERLTADVSRLTVRVDVLRDELRRLRALHIAITGSKEETDKRLLPHLAGSASEAAPADLKDIEAPPPSPDPDPRPRD
jgi:RNA polymerase sigma factor (sigma-70 family)